MACFNAEVRVRILRVNCDKTPVIGKRKKRTYGVYAKRYFRRGLERDAGESQNTFPSTHRDTQTHRHRHNVHFPFTAARHIRKTHTHCQHSATHHHAGTPKRPSLRNKTNSDTTKLDPLHCPDYEPHYRSPLPLR